MPGASAPYIARAQLQKLLSPNGGKRSFDDGLSDRACLIQNVEQISRLLLERRAAVVERSTYCQVVHGEEQLIDVLRRVVCLAECRTIIADIERQRP